MYATVAVLFSSAVNAQSICEKKGCTSDDFFIEALWTARQISEAKSSEYEVTLLRACLFMTIVQINEKLFKGSSYLSVTQFNSWMNTPKVNLASAPDWYVGCKDSLTPDQFSAALVAILATQREKTSFTSILASPNDYKKRTVRVDGFGQFAMNTLFLKRSLDDLNPVAVDVSDQAADIRERLVKQCGSATSQCKLTIWGKVTASSPVVTISTTGEMIEFRK